MNRIEHLLPEEIEKRSFEIISEELNRRGVILPTEEEMITKRVIHTSADFDYTKTLTYSKDAVRIAKELILNGADIVTDTNMALSGINKKTLARFGGEVHCFMAEEEVARLAKERGTTRAAISMEMAAKLKKPVIFAIGNAPTALIQLYEMIDGRLETCICDWCSCRFCECRGSKGTDYGNGGSVYCESWKKRRK